MHYIIGSAKQLENLIQSVRYIVPDPVLEQIKRTTETLDNCYGSERDLNASLGGYAILFTTTDKNDKKTQMDIFQKYNIREQDYEYRDCIASCGGLKWMEELFILSSDYSLVMYYPLSSEN